MEIQIGKRKTFFCNVKAVLLFLVIYGHLIEPRIKESTVLLWQYRFIYMFHMPMFAMITGMFLKTSKACMNQIKNAGLYYVLCQGVCIVLSYVLRKPHLSFFKPWWYLWYLLSMVWWALFCLVTGKVKKTWMHILLLVFSIVLACLCGNWDIGRTLSASRTICFLPYVLLGRLISLEKKFSEGRWCCIGVGGIAIVAFVLLSMVLPVDFFYQVSSYAMTDVMYGENFRFLSVLVSMGIGLPFLAWIPEKKYRWTKVGSDTMGVYLLQGPFVLFVRNMEMELSLFIVAAPVVAFSIYFVLYELCRWRGKWCRIT